MWALNAAQFANLWALILLTSYTPTYLTSVFGFDIKNSGFMSALPYLVRLVGGWVFGIIGDFVISKEYLSRNKARKIFITFCNNDQFVGFFV